MAFFSKLGKLGEAVIDLVINPKPMEEGLDQAKDTVETQTEEMARACEENLKGRFTLAAKDAADSIVRIGDVIGKATAAFGIMVTAFSAGAAIGKKVFGDWEEALVRVRTQLDLIREIQVVDSLEGAAASTQRLNDRLEEVNAEVQTFQALVANGFNLTANLLYDIELLEKEQELLRSSIDAVSRRAVKIKEEAEAREAAAEATRKQAEAQDELNKKLEEGARRLAEFQKMLDGDFAVPDFVGPIIPEDIIEQMEEAGKKAGEAFSKSFNSALDAQTSISSITGSIETMRQTILDEIQTLKLRGSI